MKAFRIIYLYLSLGLIISQTPSLEPQDTQDLTFATTQPGSKRLEKYESIKVNANEYMIVFNSEDFKDGEEMYFKIKALKDKYLEDRVYYEYIGANTPYDWQELKPVPYQIKTEEEIYIEKTYLIRYFTITKNKNDFRQTNGNLLLIYFMIEEGEVEITNTEKDEGKFETWKIAVIVVAAVVVIGFSITCFCIRRKRELAAANQAAGYGQPATYGQTANVNQYGQTANNYDPNVIQYDNNQPPVSNYGGGY